MINPADLLIVALPAVVFDAWVLVLIHVYVLAYPEGYWNE